MESLNSVVKSRIFLLIDAESDSRPKAKDVFSPEQNVVNCESRNIQYPSRVAFFFVARNLQVVTLMTDYETGALFRGMRTNEVTVAVERCF